MKDINPTTYACQHRGLTECSNDEVAAGHRITDSLQSSWYCSTCPRRVPPGEPMPIKVLKNPDAPAVAVERPRENTQATLYGGTTR